MNNAKKEIGLKTRVEDQLAQNTMDCNADILCRHIPEQLSFCIFLSKQSNETITWRTDASFF
jgi:hypothetical protein